MNTIDREINRAEGVTTKSANIAAIARQLYKNADAITRLKQGYRPYICPFHLLVDLVPDRANVLDIGCGSGLFLGLLARLDILASATGFDSSAPSIETARSMNLPDQQKERINFEVRNVKQAMPSGPFSVVSLIDVLHHVPPSAQEDVIRQALSRVEPGGYFIYKDMVSRPLWRACANRLHDLILAGDWINYFELERTKEIALDSGFQEVIRSDLNMFWYGHEWLVVRRPSEAGE